MSVAFLMLAHDRLDRAGALAAHLVGQGARVAAHIDARTDEAAFAAACPDALLVRPRVAAEWGMFSLVEATLAGLEALAEEDVSHIMLISGADLPIRSVAELMAFLDAHPDQDFIEAVDPDTNPWVIDGLASERFRYWFPVSWRRQRRLFDALVWAQRRLKVRRRVPAGVRPMIGAQWWCLSRKTVQAILSHPDLPALKRFFRWTWVPDEGFFQTLAAAVAPDRIAGRSLTFARFDPFGRPFVFYDDHLEALSGADAFFARKVWPGADELYAHFLSDHGATERSDVLEGLVASAEHRHAYGRTGLLSQGRLPRKKAKERKRTETPGPYVAILGLEGLGEDAVTALGPTLHGRIFRNPPGRFGGGAQVGPGGSVAAPGLVGYAPEQMLANLVQAAAPDLTAVMVGEGDQPALLTHLTQDPNMRLLALRHGWAMDPAIRTVEQARAAQALERRLIAACGDAVVIELRDGAGALEAAFGTVGLPAPKAALPDPAQVRVAFDRWTALGLTLPTAN